MQASVWYLQLRLEEAESETLRALEIYEKDGLTWDADMCQGILQDIRQAMINRSTA